MEFVKEYMLKNSRQMVDAGYHVLQSICILLACFLVSYLFKKGLAQTKRRYPRLDETFFPIFTTTVTYLIYTIGGIFMLDLFGVNTSSIITLLGAAGIAVGFALKDTLGNIAAGIMLLFLRPFRIGDFIEFGSVMGTVRELNLFQTILETFDGLYVASPNSAIWGNSIINYSRNGKRRMKIEVSISYGDSIQTALDVLWEMIHSEQRVLTDPMPDVMVVALEDSGVKLQFRAWVKVDAYWDVYWAMNRQVKERIEAAGLTIPFPQQDVHVNILNHGGSEGDGSISEK